MGSSQNFLRTGSDHHLYFFAFLKKITTTGSSANFLSPKPNGQGCGPHYRNGGSTYHAWGLVCFLNKKCCKWFGVKEIKEKSLYWNILVKKLSKSDLIEPIIWFEFILRAKL